MRANSLKKFLAILIAGVLMAATPAGLAWAKKQDLVIFGDSLSDTGNRFFVSGIKNTPPYDLAAAQDLVPSFPYAIGGATYTNGSIWIEHLARAISRGGVSQAALASSGTGANYAYAGARASSNPPPPIELNDNLHLSDQVDRYLADVKDTASSTALFIIFIGGNDLGEALGATLLGFPIGDQVVAGAVGSVASNVLQKLYPAGARRFLFVTAPNVGSVPRFSRIPIPPGLPPNLPFIIGAALADGYNAGVQANVINALSAAGAEVHVLDVRGLFDEINDNPGDFGFANTSDHCIMPFEPPFQCKNPDTYVYWDNFHPTARVHEILGERAIQLMTP